MAVCPCAVTWQHRLPASSLPSTTYCCVLQMHRNPSALEAPAGKDSTDQTVADMIEDETEISPDEAATQQLLNKDMENLLYTLSARESAVLKLRYGLDDGREKTLEEVGRILLVRPLHLLS